MAEIAIAASIIAVAGAGAKMSSILHQLASDIGSAGKDARMIGNEVSSFCSIMNVLGTTLARAETAKYSTRCADNTRTLHENYLDIFDEITKFVESLRSQLPGACAKRSKWRSRAKCVFRKPRILYLRACLDSYKHNLNLALNTLELVHKVATRR